MESNISQIEPPVRFDTKQMEALISAIVERLALRLTGAIVEAQSRRFISREDYAKRHGISIRTVDRLVASGDLAHRKVGRRILIDDRFGGSHG